MTDNMATMNELLQAGRGPASEVSREMFEASREELGGYASWAIWGEETADMSVFDPAGCPWERLRRNVILAGGNTGLFGGGRPSTFTNFHTQGHAGDTKLRKAVVGTELEGAFLTDIVKNYPTGTSSDLISAINDGEVDLAQHFIEPLEKELDVLDMDEGVLLVLMGSGTEEVWRTVVEKAGDAEVLRKVTAVGGVYHYTASVDFTAEIARLLANPPIPV